jgi:hypothetical protein
MSDGTFETKWDRSRRPRFADQRRWRLAGSPNLREGATGPNRRTRPLEALPASTSLIVLHSCPFLRFVTANNATCRCAKDAMVTSEMARSTAHHSTF